MTLTPNQNRIAEEYIDRTKLVPGLLKFTCDADGRLDLADASDNAAAFWMQLLGLTHGEELSALLYQLANLAPNKAAVAATVNSSLASIAAMGPRDSIELMLCSQMVAMQAMTLRVAGQSPATFEASSQQANAVTKLGKTFAAQVEALTRYRARGQQNIKVEHVHVHDGGQVAIGSFGPGGGGAIENGNQPHVRKTAQLPERQAVLGHLETVGVTLQGASGEGLDSLPVSRREGRSSDGKP